VAKQCDAEKDAATCCDPDFRLTQDVYEEYFKANGCGRDKLQEGIDSFTKDTEKLREILISKFG
jgi:transaldolase